MRVGVEFPTDVPGVGVEDEVLVHHGPGADGGNPWPAAGSNREFIQVDPATLHVPPGRPQGADPGKLARQIARYGRSIGGMPPLEVVRGRGGALRINDGVTRATRAAKLLPGQTVPAEVIQTIPNLDVSRFPNNQGCAPMNDHERSALLRALTELSERYPHWRFGQLVSNVAGWADVDVWDVEDSQLLTAAESHLDPARGRDPKIPG